MLGVGGEVLSKSSAIGVISYVLLKCNYFNKIKHHIQAFYALLVWSLYLISQNKVK